MIYPNELGYYDFSNFNELEIAIDDSIKRYHGFHNWEQAIIETDLSPCKIRLIIQKYKNAGWKHIYCCTHSSDTTNPKPETMFIFSMEDLNIPEWENFPYGRRQGYFGDQMREDTPIILNYDGCSQKPITENNYIPPRIIYEGMI